ncbi:hypothetical protein RSAG8_11844, partial [Rhizoctonia solani AG-8 WAC10335]
MPNFTSVYFNSALQRLAIPRNSQLCYVLLGILGTTGVLVLSGGTRSDSNISMLVGPTPSSAVWEALPICSMLKEVLSFKTN